MPQPLGPHHPVQPSPATARPMALPNVPRRHLRHHQASALRRSSCPRPLRGPRPAPHGRYQRGFFQPPASNDDGCPIRPLHLPRVPVFAIHLQRGAKTLLLHAALLGRLLPCANPFLRHVGRGRQRIQWTTCHHARQRYLINRGAPLGPITRDHRADRAIRPNVQKRHAILRQTHVCH